ncbi:MULTISPECIES: hypothetical protein [Thioclava]|uniref:Uncharacterized protein n=1 Tax=Thioclava kandeliae TaxID=3070818 RepID=A0ABV1SJ65_9RHOB
MSRLLTDFVTQISRDSASGTKRLGTQKLSAQKAFKPEKRAEKTAPEFRLMQEAEAKERAEKTARLKAARLARDGNE